MTRDDGSGGGGGGTPATDPNATFAGLYAFASFEGDAGPEVSSTSWGTAVADGMGTLGGVTGYGNSDGTLNFLTVPGLPCAVGAGGVLTLQTGGGGVDDMRGGISADGRIAFVGQMLATNNPSIIFMTRRAGAFGAASLNGDYDVCLLFDSIAGTDGDGALMGTATFDGAGGVNYSLRANNVGSVGAPFLLVSTYAVSADGQFSMPMSGSTFVGNVLQGGDVVFAGGGAVAGNVRGLAVLIRQSATASPAAASGPYPFVAIHADVAPAAAPHWTSLRGVMTADGAGTFTSNSVERVSDDGTAGTLPSGIAQPCTVAPDGATTLTTAVSVRGGVASDGSFAALCGSTVDTEDIQFWVFLR